MITKSFDFNLAGYHLIEPLAQNAKTVVYRARFNGLELIDPRTVIIKLLSSKYPTYQELVNFRHEYKIAKNLDLPGVI